MRIKHEDLPAFITATLLAIRQGVQDARAQGLQADLPEKVDFQVELIQAVNALSTTDTTVTDGMRGTTTGRPLTVETSVKSGGGSQTDENSRDVSTRNGTTTKSDQANTTTDSNDTTELTGNEGTQETQDTSRTSTQKATEDATTTHATHVANLREEQFRTQKTYA